MDVDIKLHSYDSVKKIYTFNLSGSSLVKDDVEKLDKSILAVTKLGLIPGLRKDKRETDAPLYWFSILLRQIPLDSPPLYVGKKYRVKIGLSNKPARNKYVNVELLSPLSEITDESAGEPRPWQFW